MVAPSRRGLWVHRGFSDTGRLDNLRSAPGELRIFAVPIGKPRAPLVRAGRMGHSGSAPDSGMTQSRERNTMIVSLCAIALSALGQVNSAGPRCSAPPPGAKEECVNCFDQACQDWTDAFYKCDGNVECVKAAKEEYDDTLSNCRCRPAISTLVIILGEQRAGEAMNLFTLGGGADL